MVANNAYRVDALSVGSRDKLDGGLLHIYVLGGLLNGGWAERSAEKVVVDARPSRLRVAIDGNPGELSTPVELKIEPRALRLLVPRQPG
jgi:diacylglycerol kinase family enzyme